MEKFYDKAVLITEKNIVDGELSLSEMILTKDVITENGYNHISFTVKVKKDPVGLYSFTDNLLIDDKEYQFQKLNQNKRYHISELFEIFEDNIQKYFEEVYNLE